MNRDKMKQIGMVMIVCAAVIGMTACGGIPKLGNNLISDDENNIRIVRMFSPMEKTMPDADNVARSASDKTVVMAEEALGVSLD